MSRKLLPFMVSVIFSSLVLAQQVQWIARYDGPANYIDQATGIALDGEGNIYVTGFSYSLTSNFDYMTIKYNSSGDTLWTARYNGLGNYYDKANAIAADEYGNIYITGQSTGSGTGNDFTTIKYSLTGDKVWVARYNGPVDGSDIANAIALDGAGNVYITGPSPGVGTGNDFTTIKYSSSGDTLWTARYNSPENSSDISTAIAVDGAGNVYVTGYTIGSAVNDDCITIKYNSSGEMLWVARYNSAQNWEDEAKAIAVDESGSVYVVGWVSNGVITKADYLTIKYNSSGEEEWVSRYGGSGVYLYEADAMVLDDSGKVYVTGTTLSSDSNYHTTIKYNSEGDTSWIASCYDSVHYGGNATSIAVDGSGNVYVTGYSFSGIYKDYATVKYDSSGQTQWLVFYNGPANEDDLATAIAVDSSGNVYVTGWSSGSGTHDDYTTIKYEPFITPVELIAFTAATNGNNVTLNWSTAAEKNNQGFEVQRSTGNSDFRTIGFVKGSGTKTEEQIYSFKDEDLSSREYQYRLKQIDFNGSFSYSNTIDVIIMNPTEFSLSQNYPNPFNPATKIKFSILQTSKVAIKIFNILGDEIETLINKEKPAGTYEVEFNGNGLPSGVYYYQIKAGSFVQTKKMILLK